MPTAHCPTSFPPGAERRARHVRGEHAAGALQEAHAVVDGERHGVEGDVVDALADVARADDPPAAPQRVLAAAHQPAGVQLAHVACPLTPVPFVLPSALSRPESLVANTTWANAVVGSLFVLDNLNRRDGTDKLPRALSTVLPKASKQTHAEGKQAT